MAFSENARKILEYRYLAKDEDGNVVESIEEMFQRVALLAAIPEILYDEKVYDKDGRSYNPQFIREVKWIPLSAYEGIYLDSENELFRFNEWHLEALVRLYVRLAQQGKMKMSLRQILDILRMDGSRFIKARVWAHKFYRYMVEQIVMPNTPALVNAGRRLGLLSACFVIPIEDDMRSIMRAATDCALIFKAGGGVGIDFSSLRPEGDTVGSTGGVASGPVSFMELIDKVADVVKQGGVRRGALMSILWYWHPDIEKFIYAKRDNDGKSRLANMNISVGTDEDFWDAVRNDSKVDIINPRSGELVERISARKILKEIARMAWKTGDPGVIFFDNVNKYNVFIERFGLITATNPCGEEPLYPYESCNLAAINVEKFVKDGKFDWDGFREAVEVATRMLDNFIDVNKFPLREIEEMTLRTRKIGVGIMGLARALYRLGIKYNSKEGYEFMSRLAEFLTYHVIDTSVELAKERGAFPEFEESGLARGKLPIAGYYDRDSWTLDWDRLVEKIKEYGVRNGDFTTCQPTGSVSMICDTSAGIEPEFALVYKKVVSAGEFYYVCEPFKEELVRRGLYSEELIKRIAENGGSIQDVDEIPDDMKDVFVTARDIHWADHIMAQAVLQKWISGAISKTINMPNTATVEDVERAIIMAHELGCKGITVYRDGSLQFQVYVADGHKASVKMSDVAEHEYRKIFGGSTVCPVCGSELILQEGCGRCPSCGWARCG